MKKERVKNVLKWIKIAALIYVLGAIALYFLQDAILFRPKSLKSTYKYDFPEKHEDINIPVNDNSNLNIIRFFSTDTITKGAVLYFHGNKKNIAWYAKYPPFFTRHGYEVWMIDYPGFGKSTGRFTEENLYNWAGYLYKYVNSKFSSEHIIIYGKSMGTGIASQLASKQACKSLILETPYYNFPSILKTYLPFYPINRMIKYEFPTHRYLLHTHVPVTIFQGTADRIVTYSNAERLKVFLKPGDEFISIEGGSHNDLFKFKQTISKLDSLLKN
ncbi:MAG TPA: alpha/beta hydrolase [Chitinophagaceae bacterium]|nr:alpha/beta hydrolase [Chitinophagaceae bacterium]